MVTIKTKFTRGKVSVTIEKRENATLKEAITVINILDVKDVVNAAPEEVCYPDNVSITVSNGLKSYTRTFNDIVYAVGKVSWGYRDPESLSYFWDKL